MASRYEILIITHWPSKLSDRKPGSKKPRPLLPIHTKIIIKDYFKKHLQFLPIWSRVCELGSPNEKTSMTNTHTELHFHLKKSNDEANNIPRPKYLYEKIPSTTQTFESDTNKIEEKSIEETWTPRLSSKSAKLKTSFLKKPNKHLVLDAKKKFKKSRTSVDRKAKSIREYKKKPSSENSNTEENKSTNLA